MFNEVISVCSLHGYGPTTRLATSGPPADRSSAEPTTISLPFPGVAVHRRFAAVGCPRCSTVRASPSRNVPSASSDTERLPENFLDAFTGTGATAFAAESSAAVVPGALSECRSAA